MKKYLMMGVAAVTLASCSHDLDLYDQGAVDNLVVEKYKQAFIKNFGQPAPDQDWGFGSTTRGVTRTTWTDNHSCNWESMLKFTVPSDAKDLTKGDFTDDERNSGVQGAVYVIPENFSGDLNLDYKVKFNNCTIYNLGNVTNITNVNMEGVITFYNVGTMIWNITSGQRHTIINTGTFTLANDANIGTLYNGGHLEITDTDISNSVTINSNSESPINMPNGGDFKAAADIHGTLTSAKDVKIQNSNTQYICGITVNGTLDLTQGKLESSYIEANHIKFDGDQLWLLPGGHVSAGSIEIPNGCYVYGEASSTGLIEVGDISFKNDNDFDRTFSDNIYFKITGSIDFTGATNGAVKEKRKYADAADYIAVNGNLNNNRLNGGNASGNPACGQPWSVGTTTPTPDPDPTPDPEDPEITITDDDVFLCRVFGEDLSAEEAGDFDFNDVVFDVYTNGTDAKIVLQAAGGTLPLYVEGKEIHEAFGVATNVMVNTGAGANKDEVVLQLIVPGVKDAADVNAKIKVEVMKDKLYTLEAITGEPAAKFAVDDQNVGWPGERTDIKDMYTGFTKWVQEGAKSNSKFWE